MALYEENFLHGFFLNERHFCTNGKLSDGEKKLYNIKSKIICRKKHDWNLKRLIKKKQSRVIVSSKSNSKNKKKNNKR